MAFLAPLEAYQEQLLSEQISASIQDFQWAIQEYRISLFAQQLKTQIPISPQRLQKQWLEIDDQLRRFLISPA